MTRKNQVVQVEDGWLVTHDGRNPIESSDPQIWQGMAWLPFGTKGIAADTPLDASYLCDHTVVDALVGAACKPWMHGGKVVAVWSKDGIVEPFDFKRAAKKIDEVFGDNETIYLQPDPHSGWNDAFHDAPKVCSKRHFLAAMQECFTYWEENGTYEGNAVIDGVMKDLLARRVTTP